MSNLLLEERPLLVMPKLATLIGLPESIFLQQLHYWTGHSTNVIDGNRWVYNSVKEWKKQFPFWSERTIQRVIKNLESSDLIIIGNFNKLPIDRTKWYRINYEKLYSLEPTSPISPNGQTYRQNGDMDLPKVVVGLDKMATPLPEITTKITTDINNDDDDEHSEKIETAFAFYQENGFGILSPYIGDKIGAWIDDLSEELVIYALKLSAENNARNWKYAETILRNWFNANLRTLAEVEAENKKREDAKQKNPFKSSGRPIREEKIPESFNAPQNSFSEEDKKQLDEERRRLQAEFRNEGD